MAYYVQGTDKTLYFTPGGVTFALTAPAGRGERRRASGRGRALPGRLAGPRAMEPAPRSRWAVKLDFVGANPDVRPVGEDRPRPSSPTSRARQKQWHTGLPTYSRIVYRDLWPGIDLVYYGTVEPAEVRVHRRARRRPGADPPGLPRRRAAWR